MIESYVRHILENNLIDVTDDMFMGLCEEFKQAGLMLLDSKEDERIFNFLLADSTIHLKVVCVIKFNGEAIIYGADIEKVDIDEFLDLINEYQRDENKIVYR